VTVHDLPAVNASLNGASAILLGAAYICIKCRKVKAHATLMISAVATSAIFLGCYIVYHVSVPPKSIGLPAGPLRTAYLVLLASHVILAIGMLPMIYLTLLRAYRRQWKEHLKIAPPTFWIWFYVSVTGVVVYWFLYHFAPSLYPELTRFQS
jgi:uncharacterized membrane protein YozB (DUF420 family)